MALLSKKSLLVSTHPSGNLVEQHSERYHISWEPRGAIARFQGACTGQDIKQAVDDIQQHNDFCDLRWIIYDQSEVEKLDFSPHEPEWLAASDLGASFTNPNIRLGFVATHEAPVHYVQAYLAAGVSPYSSQLFATVSAARSWALALGALRMPGCTDKSKDKANRNPT